MATITSSDDGNYNDSTLTCSGSAVDNDGDALTESYVWSTGDTAATVTLDGSLPPGDELTCTATLSDGTDSAPAVHLRLQRRLSTAESSAHNLAAEFMASQQPEQR